MAFSVKKFVGAYKGDPTNPEETCKNPAVCQFQGEETYKNHEETYKVSGAEAEFVGAYKGDLAVCRFQGCFCRFLPAICRFPVEILGNNP
jgi:hypothetical protein